MKTLMEYIQEAEEKKVALGHFNISNTEGLWGIFNAARNVSASTGIEVPIIIGVSEGERDFIGIQQAVALVRSLREQYDYPIFLNADHTYSFDRFKESVDAGVDSIILDGAQLSLEKNTLITKRCVEYARKKAPTILVEGEVGYIGSSSKILDEIPEGVTEETMTNPDVAQAFVEETKVDLLAPSVGNIHGIVKTGNPRIDVDRIKKLRDATGVPLVLHGGSGITDEDFVKAIKAGISLIHINTEIRIAYKRALTLSLQENPEEIAPYRILKPAVQAIQKVVESRLRLFNGIK